jgi:hypothetical protein
MGIQEGSLCTDVSVVVDAKGGTSPPFAVIKTDLVIEKISY